MRCIFPHMRGHNEALLKLYVLNDQKISHVDVAAYPEEAAFDLTCISHLSSFNLTAFTKVSL